MDNSELHYVSFDPDETWQEMNLAYLKAGGDILYGGDEKEILLRSVLAIAESIMAKVDSALRMDTLTYAVRDYLDIYGEKRNCARIQATPATATVRITFRATGTAKTYPANDTALTADGVVLYHLAEDVSFTGYAGSVDATIECNEAGVIGNGLAEGSQMQMIESDDAILSIIVLAESFGGTDREDDDTYRERIRTYGLSSVTTGPSDLYEAKAKAVSTQIIDARALNDGGGEVGVYLLLEEGASQSSIFATVQQVLSAADTRPLTDHVTVSAANEAAYTLNVEIYVGNFTGLSASIEDTVAAYQKWQDNAIGREFNPDRLVAMLYQIGVDRVRFLPGSGMSGSLDYRPIAQNAHCKGTITPTVIVT